MTKQNVNKNIASIQQILYFLFVIKWLFLAAIMSIGIGSASAFLLVALDWATNYRENHLWIIALLPLGGLCIGLNYHYFGSSVVKGNNLLLEEFHSPKQIIRRNSCPNGGRNS